ncbi:MAG: aminoglycoside adenylyltransferase [Haloplasmataceae bacterium]|jgi:aminoglycoside 6-adenylyltransferase|nr:aminoglycoside adenylyltransferase [Haloplasmataceae bacterium]
MRTEKEMFDLILSVPKKDERIRAVTMNGSRTNPNVKKDHYQDFDIVYLVTDVTSFLDNNKWLDIFGERLIMQTPDTMTLFEPEKSSRFAYLIQFIDGNRIDLTLVPIEEKEAYLQEDRLTVILLDKDNSLPGIPSPTDQDYWVLKPTQDFFNDCCNEFWWVSTYVAKGLWRYEMLYAIDHLEIIRKMLLKMLEWSVGIKTNFSISVGKNDKYLQQYLDESIWLKLLETYPLANYDAIWSALLATCDLFRTAAFLVSKHFNYKYLDDEYQEVMSYMFNKKA